MTTTDLTIYKHHHEPIHVDKFTIHYNVPHLAAQQRDELLAAVESFLIAWDSCRSSGEWPVSRLQALRETVEKVKGILK